MVPPVEGRPQVFGLADGHQPHLHGCVQRDAHRPRGNHPSKIEDRTNRVGEGKALVNHGPLPGSIADGMTDGRWTQAWTTAWAKAHLHVMRGRPESPEGGGRSM